MNRILLSLTTVALAASSAYGEPKSWTALKSNVPTNSEILLSADFKALRAAGSFAKVIDGLPEVGPALGMIKTTCGLDPAAVISDIAVSIKSKGPDEIIVAVGLDGVDEAKLVDCATKLVKSSKPKAKVATKSGKLHEYTISDGTESKTIYAVWPAKDVVVFSAKAEDKATLDAYFNGKPVQGDMATYFGKLSTANTVGWVAAVVNEDHVKGAYGSAAFAKGMFTGTMHVVADSAKDATKLAKEGTDGIKKALTRAPANIAKVLNGIKIGAAGDHVTVDGTLADADLPALVPAFLKM